MQNHRSFYTHHLEPAFGHLPIAAIDTEAVENFIEAKRATEGSVRRKGKPLADSSLKVGLITLGLILRFAVRRRLIAESPMAQAEWTLRRHTTNIDPFTLPELQAIIQAADDLQADFGTLLRVWVQTGARKGEALALSLADLDLTEWTARISKTWSRGRLGETKTRVTRTSSFLHPILEATKEWEPEGATAVTRSVLAALQVATLTATNQEAFLFHATDGGGKEPCSDQEVYKLWNKAITVAGVRYRSPEQLRHTFVCTMLSRNAPVLYVAEQAGHSAATMLKFYAKWMPKVGRAARKEDAAASTPASSAVDSR